MKIFKWTTIGLIIAMLCFSALAIADEILEEEPDADNFAAVEPQADAVSEDVGASERRGRIVLKPMIIVSARHDNNYYKAEDKEAGIFTYLIRPGITAGYETAKTSIMLKYTLDAHFFDNEHDSNKPEAYRDNYVGHTAQFSANMQPFERLSFGVDDQFYKTIDPPSSNPPSSSEFDTDELSRDKYSNAVERESITTNSLSPWVTYSFNQKFSTGLRYRHTIDDYEDDNSDDSVEHRGIFDFIYHFSERASLDLEYQHWLREYDGSTADYDSDQISLIFRKAYAHISFEAGAGYHFRHFDKGEPDDIDALTYQISVTGKGPAISDGRPRSEFKVSVERNFNDYTGTDNDYYVSTIFKLNAHRIFRERLIAGISGKYISADYERWSGMTPGGRMVYRQDDTYDISISLGYMIRQSILLKIAAGYEERDSNIAGYDYENNYILTTVEYTFDTGK